MPRRIRLEPLSKLPMQRIEEVMEWIPIVLITFKLLVLGAAMFFSIKSHYDKEKEEQEEERQRQKRSNASQAPAVHDAGANMRPTHTSVERAITKDRPGDGTSTATS